MQRITRIAIIRRHRARIANIPKINLCICICCINGVFRRIFIFFFFIFFRHNLQHLHCVLDASRMLVVGGGIRVWPLLQRSMRRIVVMRRDQIAVVRRWTHIARRHFAGSGNGNGARFGNQLCHRVRGKRRELRARRRCNRDGRDGLRGVHSVHGSGGGVRFTRRVGDVGVGDDTILRLRLRGLIRVRCLRACLWLLLLLWLRLLRCCFRLGLLWRWCLLLLLCLMWLHYISHLWRWLLLLWCLLLLLWLLLWLV
mmetsp:Transcript_34485/g.56137  ORF Transcript_34485/g.56137 Transcript_34485/m.56137 type:complete len:255 (+) Transcript_34485:678-1442(+)